MGIFLFAAVCGIVVGAALWATRGNGGEYYRDDCMVDPGDDLAQKWGVDDTQDFEDAVAGKVVGCGCIVVVLLLAVMIAMVAKLIG